MDILIKINRPPTSPTLTLPPQEKLIHSKNDRTKGSFNKIKSGNSPSPLTKKALPMQSFGVTALDSLFLNDETGQEKKMKQMKRGNDLLDELERLRIAILMGEIPQQGLVHLADLLKNKQDIASDPQLHEIIQEIETRVAVELAKFTVK